MLPEGWKISKLGEIARITTGSTPTTTNESFYNGDILFITPADLGDNKYVTQTERTLSLLGAECTRLIPKYSVLFSCIGTIGKTGINTKDAATNQQINSIFPNTHNNSDFIYYSLILNKPSINTLAGKQAVPIINKKTFSNVSILLPPLPEQKKIAAILSTWDRAIEGTEKLLANSQQQKKALMQQLLTGKKRLPGFTGEWKRQSFKVIFDVDNQKDTQTPASEYKEEGHIPIVDQGKSFISGYTDTNTVYENVPVIIFGDHTRVIKWVDFPFSPGADGTQVLRTRANTLNKFGYYLLQNTDLPNLGYSRHMKELKEQIFHLPPLPEQKAIAAVLTTADEEITALESDLSRLRQEKKSLMQQLLTGKRRVTVD